MLHAYSDLNEQRGGQKKAQDHDQCWVTRLSKIIILSGVSGLSV